MGSIQKEATYTSHPETNTTKGNYFSSEVGYYSRHNQTVGENVTIENFLDAIKNPDAKTLDAIKKVRSFPYHSSEQKTEKEKLPVYTLSGTFSNKGKSVSNLKTHSRIVAVDIDLCDNDEETAQHLKQVTENDPYSFASFYSASGESVCTLVKIGDTSKHEESYKEICSHYKNVYNINCDKACFKVNRLRFASYDPDLYVDEYSYVFNIESSGTIIKKQYSSNTNERPGDLFNNSFYATDEVLNALTGSGWKSTDNIHWTRPNKKSGCSATLGKVAPNVFYVFSSNAESFDSGHAYSPFQVVALLNYNGNFSAAATALNEKYFKTENQQKSTLKIDTKPKSTPINYFETRTFAEILQIGEKEPDRKKIIGAFLYQDTNTYLFGRTNDGKSLWVFEIAFCAATGQSVNNCTALLNECKPMKVLVFDLEMDAKTIYDRHSAALKSADSALLQNLIYVHENSSTRPSFGFDLLDKIEAEAIKNKAELVIIDNISKILPDLLKAEDVAKTIEYLKRIRQKTGCSFLIIGHTTKGDPRTAVTPTSYYGSAALQNFFTEITFLDKTNNGNFFLCHSKTKRAECYTENVPVFTRGKSERFGVGFEYQALRTLSEIQLPQTINTHPNRKVNLSEFKKEINMMNNAGINQSTIAKMCNSSRQNISKLISSPL